MGNWDYDYTKDDYRAVEQINLGLIDWTTTTVNTTLNGQNPLYIRMAKKCVFKNARAVAAGTFTSVYISSTTVGPYLLVSKITASGATTTTIGYVYIGYTTIGYSWSATGVAATAITETTLAAGDVVKVAQSAVDATGKSFIAIEVLPVFAG